MNRKKYYLTIRDASVLFSSCMMLSITFIKIWVDIVFPISPLIFISQWIISLCIFTIILILILIIAKFLIDEEVKNNPNLYCQICKDLLDKSSDFPEDFPDKYKLCCNCWNIVRYIYDKGLNIDWDWADKFYRERKKKFDEIFVVKKGV